MGTILSIDEKQIFMIVREVSHERSQRKKFARDLATMSRMQVYMTPSEDSPATILTDVKIPSVEGLLTEDEIANVLKAKIHEPIHRQRTKSITTQGKSSMMFKLRQSSLKLSEQHEPEPESLDMITPPDSIRALSRTCTTAASRVASSISKTSAPKITLPTSKVLAPRISSPAPSKTITPRVASPAPAPKTDSQCTTTIPNEVEEKEKMKPKPKSVLSKLPRFSKQKATTKEEIRSKSKSPSSSKVVQGGVKLVNKNPLPVEIVARFKSNGKESEEIQVSYSYDSTKKESNIQSNASNDVLSQFDIKVDKNGNPDVKTFIKSIPKLMNNYDGVLTLNGYQISMDADASRRIKVSSLDIESNPMILALNPKGMIGAKALRSTTKLELRGSEYETDETFKWIRVEGNSTNIRDIKIVSPASENTNNLHICFPVEAK